MVEVLCSLFDHTNPGRSRLVVLLHRPTADVCAVNAVPTLLHHQYQRFCIISTNAFASSVPTRLHHQDQSFCNVPDVPSCTQSVARC